MDTFFFQKTLFYDALSTAEEDIIFWKKKK